MTYYAALAVLKTDTRMSAKNPMTNEFAESGLVAYLMVNNKGNAKMVTSWGALEMQVGDTATLIGDQSGRNLGVHTVYAIIDLSTQIKYFAKGVTHLFPNTYPHYVVK